MRLGFTSRMVPIWLVGSVLGFLATVLILGWNPISAVGLPAFLAELHTNLGRFDPPSVALVPVVLWLASLWGSRTWKWIPVPAIAGGLVAIWALAVATLGV